MSDEIETLAELARRFGLRVTLGRSTPSHYMSNHYRPALDDPPRELYDAMVARYGRVRVELFRQRPPMSKAAAVDEIGRIVRRYRMGADG